MPKTCPVCATVYPDTDAFCPKDGTTLQADEGDGSLVGSVIADRYLVSKLLGEGGMGQVYLAGHVRLPQQAAIKVLHSSMLKDSGAVSRFNREAANAARIEHERVARVFDFGETGNGLVYLAMEFVPGKTLGELLEEFSKLPATRAANIIYQVAEGLDAAHKISIVHRDLKPDNVLVITDENGVDRCKVVDFGIAKAFDDSDSGKTQLTQAGAIIGTPEFMSPEQVLGEQLDARSDVYALAVVGYQLFTGELPFVATTPERSLTARLISDPQTLHDGAPDIEWPEALQEAFDRALAREPDERSSTALEFAEAVVMAVEAWTGTGVLRGRTPLSTGSLGTPTAGSSAVSGTAAGGTRTATGPRSATVETAASVSEVPAKRGSGMLVGGAVALLLAVGGGGYFMMSSGGGDAPAPDAAAETTLADVGTAVSAAEERATEARAAADAARDEAQSSSPPVATPQPTTTPQTPTGQAAAPPPVEPAAPPATNASSSAAPTNNAAVGNPATASDGPSDQEAARAELNALVAQVQNSESEAVARAAIPRFESLLGRFATPADSGAVYLQLTLTHGALGNTLGKCTSYRSFKRLAVTNSLQTMVLNLEGGGAVSDCLR